MIGKMERTENKDVETYVGAMEIDGMLVVQTAIRSGEKEFQTQRLMLSKGREK